MFRMFNMAVKSRLLILKMRNNSINLRYGVNVDEIKSADKIKNR